MSESVNLPALGESVTEGTVTRWLKNVGDRVEVDEPLLEVSTDKVDTEIPSPIAGIIEAILVAEDETVEVGTPLVRIGDGSAVSQLAPSAPESITPAAPEDAQPAAAAQPTSSLLTEIPSTDAPAPAEYAPQVVPPAPADSIDPVPAAAPTPTPAAEIRAAEIPAAAIPAPSAVPAPAPAPAPAVIPAAAPPMPVVQEMVSTEPSTAGLSMSPLSDDTTARYVTPLVRKLANENGVDLSTLNGTGVGGRIRKEDVLAAVAPSNEAPSLPAIQVTPVMETSPLRGTSVPMSRLRKVIAERAVISMQSSAQLTSVVEVDVTLIARLRDRVKAEFVQQTGVKLSFLPFFALAAAEALRSYPIINSTIDGDTIVYPPQENMAIAVDTERGLLTPVIRDAGSLDLAGLAVQIADLALRTRENKLKPDELAGGTFTLTNTGSRGALFDTPIVFLPQSAILGTGIVSKKPVVVTHDGLDAIAIRSMVYLALSYDHRIVDGADAARFLVVVKTRLEAGEFQANLGI